MIYITKNNRTNHKSNLVLNEKYFMLDQSSSKYKQKKKVQFNSQNGKKKKKKKKKMQWWEFMWGSFVEMHWPC